MCASCMLVVSLASDLVSLQLVIAATGVPFQAPGIGKSPRGAAQDQGTNLKNALKGAGDQIKENNRDPDAAPFGVGKGPLVRNAKKMNQPNLTRSSGQEPSQLFRQQISSPK